MGGLTPTHLAIVLIAVIVLFGARKLPDLARSLGKSARILKDETKNLREDEKPDTKQASAEQPHQLPAAQQSQSTATPQVAPPIENSQAHRDSTR